MVREALGAFVRHGFVIAAITRFFQRAVVGGEGIDWAGMLALFGSCRALAIGSNGGSKPWPADP
ncbi:MAG: hypothetical protein JO369_06990 [Paucibacter sp.]|nr:hypothetical protein [Roseateles sp.]MBV8380488.1 hypothetical protein [Roseateles sp.]